MLNKLLDKLAEKVSPRVKVALAGKAPAPENKYDAGSAFSSVSGKTLDDKEVKELLALSFQRGQECFVTTNAGREKRPFATDSVSGKSRGAATFGLDGVAQDIIFTFFAKHGFIGWQYCALLSQHWLINNACTIPNEDAIRPGWTTSLQNKKDDTEKLLKDLSDRETKKYEVYDKMLKWGRNRKIFGIGIAYPVIKGVDLSKPFNMDGVKPGSFKGISVIDPYWAIPEWTANTISDPGDPNYYKPLYYNIGGQRIHRSHLLIWLNDEPADILKPSYYFGGVPLTQMIYERVYAAEKSANEVPELLLTKRSTIAKSDNMEAAFAQEAETTRKLTWMRKLLNNFGIWLTDAEVTQLDTTLSDTDEVINQQYQLVASVAKMPVYELMKTSPTGGIGNTGEFSTKDYKRELLSLQEHGYKNFIERIDDIILRSDFGVKDSAAVVFNEIDNTDEERLVSARNAKSKQITDLIGSGVISPEEARESLIKDEDSGFSWLSAETPLEDKGAGDKDKETKELEALIKKTLGNAQDGVFNEKNHPRDKDGKFAKGEKEKQSKEEFLGKAFEGVKGKAAIEKLIEEKQGHVPAAFTRSDIGDIDLVWGDEEKGLAHLIKRRNEEGHYSAEEVLKNLPDTLSRGYLKKSVRGRYEIHYKGYMAIVMPEYFGEEGNWLLTGFKQK